jgi:hypothetical protein
MTGAMALVDKTLEDGGFAQEETLQLMMTRALIFAQEEKFDDALKAIDDAKAFAPESPMMENINQFRQNLEQAKAQRQDASEEEPAAETEQ